MNRLSLLWMAPFCAFILGYLLFYLLLRVEYVTAPALVGTNLQHALGASSNSHLNLQLVGQREDRDIPAGTIISQMPHAGRKLRPNQSLFVVITTAPPLQPMPKLVGTPHERIKLILGPLSIKSKLFFVPSIYPTGNCIGQTPLPHQPATLEPALIYCAQQSCRPIIWPDFVGHSLENATAFLRDHQIAVQVNHEKPRPKSPDPAEATVTDQRPLAGSLLVIDPEQPPMVQLQAT